MLLILFSFSFSDTFVILFAGSNEFYNYRHQADISTFYTQIFLKSGINPKNIITFAYDDISTSSENPYSGQIFHSLEHKNIYQGSSTINYFGNQVTADNFYSVIQNIPSTASDYLLIYYDNHGGAGTLGVPENCGDYIYADSLGQALLNASSLNKWNKCLFGIEACDSGSIPPSWSSVQNILTITASGPDESSYACTYDSSLDTYLSNEFTNYWLSFLFQNPSGTVQDLWKYISSYMHQSTPQIFGDESILSLPISSFFGTLSSVTNERLINNGEKVDTMKSSHVTYFTLDNLIEKHQSIDVQRKALRTKLLLQLQKKKFKHTLKELIKEADIKNYYFHLKNKDAPVTSDYFDCVRYFTKKYGVVHGDFLPKFRIIKSLASRVAVKYIKEAIDKVIS
uniref:Clan CD family C13 asparaginyl endopeptidase-like cysteine peptidase n=1 Tax=Coptotermes formosanus TaxID=36987 RepID=L0AV39_COPFO|nr:clan CD family C13 asparaginyl endopeptidase-like cysteine peptidase [Coptotermes formosanus]